MPYSPPATPVRTRPLTTSGAPGDAVALPPVDDFDLPRDGAGLPVEREQPRVHGADVDQIGVQGDAAVVRAATVDALDLVGHLRLEVPLLRAGPGVDGEDARLVGRQVDDALVHQRGGLEAAVVAPGREHPGRVEPVHVPRGDLVQLHETVAVVVAAVHQPRRRVAGRLLEVEGGDGLPVRRHGRPRREDARHYRRHEAWRLHLRHIPPARLDRDGIAIVGHRGIAVAVVWMAAAGRRAARSAVIGRLTPRARSRTAGW